MVNVYKIIPKTSVEGPGHRFCIWVQGCKKHCNGCYSPQTWPFGVGKEISINNLYNQILSTQGIEGVTFLGGEPFEQAEELSKLACMIKSNNLSIVCFTGYEYEELKRKQDKNTEDFLKYIDLLIDGGFEKNKFDLSRPWVGSSNQRYIFLTDFYSEKQIMSYKNRVEMHISPDGKLEINGMGDFERLKDDFYLHLGKNIVK